MIATKSTIMFGSVVERPVMGLEIIAEYRDSQALSTNFSEDDRNVWFGTFLKSLKKHGSIFPEKMFSRLTENIRNNGHSPVHYDLSLQDYKRVSNACRGTNVEAAILDKASNDAFVSIGLTQHNNMGVRISFTTAQGPFGSYLNPTWSDTVLAVGKEIKAEGMQQAKDLMATANTHLGNMIPAFDKLGDAAKFFAVGAVVVGSFILAWKAGVL